MGEENAAKSVYVDTGTSGEVQEESDGRERGREKEEGRGGEGWKSANENENPHTEVVENEPMRKTFQQTNLAKTTNPEPRDV